MDDGTEFELERGPAATPPGHDGWVVGDEPVVYVEFAGADEYAKAEINRLFSFGVIGGGAHPLPLSD